MLHISCVEKLSPKTNAWEILSILLAVQEACFLHPLEMCSLHNFGKSSHKISQQFKVEQILNFRKNIPNCQLQNYLQKEGDCIPNWCALVTFLGFLFRLEHVMALEIYRQPV